MGRRLITEMNPEVSELSPEFQSFVNKVLQKCTDWNCKMPASSSGKYHPLSDLGDGGLIRHTKTVCRTLKTILSMWPQYDDKKEWSYPYAAAILHDFCKYTENEQEHSHQDHPLKMAQLIREMGADATDIDVERLASNVASHMSRWTTDKKGNKIGEFPQNMEQAFVAIADMISAQKYFVAFFEGNNIVTHQVEDWSL